MNCKYCGGTLSLEDHFCPHCGKPNEHAKQHAKDMETYKSRFDTTQGEVYKVTRNYSEITAHAVIITVLVVLILVVLFVTRSAYAIKRNIHDLQSKRYEKEYTETMDQYLEEEDYLGFHAFCEARDIRVYTEGYESYAVIMRAADHYAYIYDNLFEMMEAEAESLKDSRMESLAAYCDNFAKARENMDSYPVDEAYTEQVLQRMEEDVEALLRAYLGLTKEEAEGFSKLSKAQRMVLLEQKYEEMGYGTKITE